MSRWRARWLSAGFAAAGGLALAACAAAVPNAVGPGATSPPAPASSGAATGPQGGGSGRPAAALTGLPVSSASAARPAVALVVSGAHPKGLGAADLVFEEFTSPVRFVAVYQSRTAGTVGPIGAIRPADGQMLSVLHPLIGYQGAAAPYFTKSLDKAKVTDAGFPKHPSLYRGGTGDLTTSTWAIAGAVHGATAPPPLFQYRGPGAGTLAGSGVSRPDAVRITVPGSGVQDWDFDSHADRWTLSRGGPHVQAANVVIQTVPYQRLTVSRRQGIFVRNARVLGTGRAEVLSGSAPGGSGGTAAAGTWSKPNSGDVTNYFDSHGSLMMLQPGPTWIILAPPGTHVGASGGHQ
jgi:hypothetical protein